MVPRLLRRARGRNRSYSVVHYVPRGVSTGPHSRQFFLYHPIRVAVPVCTINQTRVHDTRQQVCVCKRTKNLGGGGSWRRIKEQKRATGVFHNVVRCTRTRREIRGGSALPFKTHFDRSMHDGFTFPLSYPAVASMPAASVLPSYSAYLASLAPSSLSSPRVSPSHWHTCSVAPSKACT